MSYSIATAAGLPRTAAAPQTAAGSAGRPLGSAALEESRPTHHPRALSGLGRRNLALTGRAGSGKLIGIGTCIWPNNDRYEPDCPCHTCTPILTPSLPPSLPLSLPPSISPTPPSRITYY